MSVHCREDVPYVWHSHLKTPQASGVGTGNAEGLRPWQSKDAPCLCSGGAGILLAHMSSGLSPGVHMVQFWSKIFINLQSEKSGMGPIPLDNLGGSNSIIQDTTSNLSSLVFRDF